MKVKCKRIFLMCNPALSDFVLAFVLFYFFAEHFCCFCFKKMNEALGPRSLPEVSYLRFWGVGPGYETELIVPRSEPGALEREIYWLCH